MVTTNTIKITKEIMSQYSDMQKEIDKMYLDIKKTEDDIARLIEEGTVCDKVTGGMGGVQGFKIEGFPIVAFERRKRLLMNKLERLREKENELMEMTEGIEVFIENISISRDRLIFRGVFLENKSQNEIAKEFHIDRSLVSRIISKYL